MHWIGFQESPALEPPHVERVEPNHGYSGDLITVHGWQLGTTATAQVRFGSGQVVAPREVASDARSLTVVVPEEAGDGPLIVETSEGGSQSEETFKWSGRGHLHLRAPTRRAHMGLTMDFVSYGDIEYLVGADGLLFSGINVSSLREVRYAHDQSTVRYQLVQAIRGGVAMLVCQSPSDDCAVERGHMTNDGLVLDDRVAIRLNPDSVEALAAAEDASLYLLVGGGGSYAVYGQGQGNRVEFIQDNWDRVAWISGSRFAVVRSLGFILELVDVLPAPVISKMPQRNGFFPYCVDSDGDLLVVAGVWGGVEVFDATAWPPVSKAYRAFPADGLSNGCAVSAQHKRAMLTAGARLFYLGLDGPGVEMLQILHMPTSGERAAQLYTPRWGPAFAVRGETRLLSFDAAHGGLISQEKMAVGFPGIAIFDLDTSGPGVAVAAGTPFLQLLDSLSLQEVHRVDVAFSAVSVSSFADGSRLSVAGAQQFAVVNPLAATEIESVVNLSSVLDTDEEILAVVPVLGDQAYVVAIESTHVRFGVLPVSQAGAGQLVFFHEMAFMSEPYDTDSEGSSERFGLAEDMYGNLVFLNSYDAWVIGIEQAMQGIAPTVVQGPEPRDYQQLLRARNGDLWVVANDYSGVLLYRVDTVQARLEEPPIKVRQLGDFQSSDFQFSPDGRYLYAVTLGYIESVGINLEHHNVGDREPPIPLDTAVRLQFLPEGDRLIAYRRSDMTLVE